MWTHVITGVLLFVADGLIGYNGHTIRIAFLIEKSFAMVRLGLFESPLQQAWIGNALAGPVCSLLDADSVLEISEMYTQRS